MPTKQTHLDQRYIIGLLQNNSVIVNEIYTRFVPKVVNYIKQNNGSEDEARDIIQEVLITIYNQAHQKDLTLTCPFDAYFFLLCKRKWLNELKKTLNKEVTLEEDKVSNYDEATELAIENELFNSKQSIFEAMFQQMNKSCKELITATFKFKSMEEVANFLGVTYAYARKKKSNCIGELTRSVQNSAAFKQLKNNL